MARREGRRREQEEGGRRKEGEVYELWFVLVHFDRILIKLTIIIITKNGKFDRCFNKLIKKKWFCLEHYKWLGSSGFQILLAPKYHGYSIWGQSYEFLSNFKLSTSHGLVVRGDTWHVTPDTWHLTCDTWHMTYVTWHTRVVKNVYKCQFPSSNCLVFMMLWKLGRKRQFT